jgi:hypothetical protein
LFAAKVFLSPRIRIGDSLTAGIALRNANSSCFVNEAVSRRNTLSVRSLWPTERTAAALDRLTFLAVLLLPLNFTPQSAVVRPLPELREDS